MALLSCPLQASTLMPQLLMAHSCPSPQSCSGLKGDIAQEMSPHPSPGATKDVYNVCVDQKERCVVVRTTNKK